MKRWAVCPRVYGMVRHLGACPLCGRISLLEHELCRGCMVTLKEKEFLFMNCHHICPTCGNPLLHSDSVCTHDRIPALFRYRGMCRELLTAYRKHRIVRLADAVAHLVSIGIERLFTGKGVVCLVPVPSYTKEPGGIGWDPNATVATRCARGEGMEVQPLLLGATPPTRIIVNDQGFHVEDFALLLVLDVVPGSNSRVELSMELLKKRFQLPVKALCVAMD